MKQGRLARVHWETGQPIFPAHLQALEEALSVEGALRDSATGLPGYGLMRFTWDPGLLSDGTLAVQGLRLILKSGRLVEAGDNATLTPERLTLEGEKPLGGKDTVTVYAHTCPSVCRAHGIGSDAPEVDTLPRCLHTVVLSTEPSLDAAFGGAGEGPPETTPLVRLVRHAERGWEMSPWIPPHLHVGRTPFFRPEIIRLRDRLSRFRRGIATLLPALGKQTLKLHMLRLCMAEVTLADQMLGNMDHGICPPPWRLQEMLDRLAIHLGIVRGEAPDGPRPPYNHEDPARWFFPLVEEITRLTRYTRFRFGSVPFQLTDGCYRAEFPAELCRSSRVYLAMVEETAAGACLTPKLGAPSRLPLLHRHALRGVEGKKVANPTAPAKAGERFHRLRTGDDEWAHACSDLALAFYAQKGHESCTFRLVFERY
ncbi:type VI secretion system baseplate subunit TssK [Desulfoluna spongiiphila]|uniref:type VI secretion system baseplate subunit TssK n=1 Tax=Desulfoluna spongiiphila TaxID=419481 RepID=UPI00125AC536|nr:type VI secretion system baseplate subunit TssK [Desulfoluna spongiiphila]VVS95580.1 type vi secretion protein vc a0114 [Desulfoluna spongiiphila]